MKAQRERGAAMIEFALIAPVLILLVLGIVEFGVRYARSAELNNAAFIAARSIAANQSVGVAQTNASNAAPDSTFTISASPATCPTTGGVDIVVTFTASEPSPTGFFPGGDTYTINAKGVARCGG